ncbi:type 2 isopentenyl-diphosphate Delta-isomerase [Candidatus Micrarchaeota archaeon]|nr:type 2 isopentenyl-diphosphate Delta-isomerase [Candidatus Micrarchaeota archaeon]
MTKKIEKRKEDHIELSLKDHVQYHKLKTGFDDVRLIYNALPEMDFQEVDASTTILNKKLSYPMIFEAMTGGFSKAEKINKDLAQTAQKYGLAMGLGSQRAMLEDPKHINTYKVRDVAPDIPLIGNIGVVQLIELYKNKKLNKIDDLVQKPELDAIAVHLNPLQEIIQPEGEKHFKGGLEAITALTYHLKKYDVKVIAKEVGSGISSEVAQHLKIAGIVMIDVAGAGGTSWSKIEYNRGKGKVRGFEEFGIPTVASILMCHSYMPVIASGGVRSGIDVTKSIVLGAEIAGAAQPFLAAQKQKNLDKIVAEWAEQIKVSMFLVGAKNIPELKRKSYFLMGETKDSMLVNKVKMSKKDQLFM